MESVIGSKYRKKKLWNSPLTGIFKVCATHLIRMQTAIMSYFQRKNIWYTKMATHTHTASLKPASERWVSFRFRWKQMAIVPSLSSTPFYWWNYCLYHTTHTYGGISHTFLSGLGHRSFSESIDCVIPFVCSPKWRSWPTTGSFLVIELIQEMIWRMPRRFILKILKTPLRK